MNISPSARFTGIYVEKDCNSVIIKCNKACLEYTSASSADQILGRTDYELPWEKYADTYRNYELDVLLNGHIYSIISPATVQEGKTLLFLQTKIRKLDEKGLACGIVGNSLEIIDPTAYLLIHSLQQNFSLPSQPFVIGKKSNEIALPKRQEEVLFYLIRGKSAKSIAQAMGISFRTVEYYITILKDKFKCNSKNELIEIAINKGFSQRIPSHNSFTELLEKLKTA